MLKLITTFGVSGLLVSSTLAFGFGILKKPHLTTSSNSATTECADLSGTWKGQCEEVSEDGTKSTTETLIIEQYACDSIAIDNEEFYVGGSKTITDNSKLDTSSTTMMVDWNKEKTGIQALFSLHGRSLNETDYQYLMTGEGTGSLKIVDDMLISNMKFEFVSKNPTDESETKVSFEDSCAYQKVK